jgi:hypothetical protein
MWSAESLPTFGARNVNEVTLPSSDASKSRAHRRPASRSGITTIRPPYDGLGSTLAQLSAPIGLVVATTPGDSRA